MSCSFSCFAWFPLNCEWMTMIMKKIQTAENMIIVVMIEEKEKQDGKSNFCRSKELHEDSPKMLLVSWTTLFSLPYFSFFPLCVINKKKKNMIGMKVVWEKWSPSLFLTLLLAPDSFSQNISWSSWRLLFILHLIYFKKSKNLWTWELKKSTEGGKRSFSQSISHSLPFKLTHH